MRTASILLILVIVLVFVSEARALELLRTEHDYTIQIGRYQFGFSDGRATGTLNQDYASSRIHFGPFGNDREVPFSAIQGLVGFCIILGTLAIVPLMLKARWKRKQPKRL